MAQANINKGKAIQLRYSFCKYCLRPVNSFDVRCNGPCKSIVHYSCTLNTYRSIEIRSDLENFYCVTCSTDILNQKLSQQFNSFLKTIASGSSNQKDVTPEKCPKTPEKSPKTPEKSPKTPVSGSSKNSNPSPTSPTRSISLISLSDTKSHSYNRNLEPLFINSNQNSVTLEKFLNGRDPSKIPVLKPSRVSPPRSRSWPDTIFPSNRNLELFYEQPNIKYPKFIEQLRIDLKKCLILLHKQSQVHSIFQEKIYNEDSVKNITLEILEMKMQKNFDIIYKVQTKIQQEIQIVRHQYKEINNHFKEINKALAYLLKKKSDHQVYHV